MAMKVVTGTKNSIERGFLKENSKKTSSSPNSQLLVNQPSYTKWKSWWTRVSWSLVMILGFSGVILSGHFYVIMLVIIIQFACFKEIITIAFLNSSLLRHRDGTQKKFVSQTFPKLPLFRSLNWYFLFCANYFIYAQKITRLLLKFIPFFDNFYYFDRDHLLGNLSAHHNFVSFLLYLSGFIVFVLTLKKGFYRFQISQFGLIWFLLPVSMIICNDCSAYLCGFFFGRTPLISLSPKKTWEGFIGAFLATMLFGLAMSRFLSGFEYMICPIEGLLYTPTINKLTCSTHPVFVPWTITLPMFSGLSFSLRPIQLHGLAMAAFGSVIAPFGGFFASGFKRAFGLKDFGDLIPGHGGVMDRFDCQLLMLTFVNVYYSSFIATGYSAYSFSKIVDTVAAMSVSRQRQLYKLLDESLKMQGYTW
ncbi:phosphatidate cytidylyltransferase 1-like [Zophobas morio]